MIIEFNDGGMPSELPVFASKDDLIDTSFSQSDKAVGKLRLPGVNNGRYEKKHPILYANGSVAGHLKGAVMEIGYTWECIYVDRASAFFLTSTPFLYKGEGGFISVIQQTGTYKLFSSGPKFERTNSINVAFGSSWHTEGFKLLSNQERLLVLTKTGFGLVDTLGQRLIYSIMFDGADHYSIQNFSISPNEKLLAISFSASDYQDPVSDEWKFKNYIKIFELSTGEELGKHHLDSDKPLWVKVQFSSDGKSLFLNGEDYQRRFELVTKSM